MQLNDQKLLELAVTSMYFGEPLPFKIRGTGAELKALSEALMATRLFETEVNNETATVKSIMEALNRKHRAAGRFQKAFGHKWPL